MGVTTMIQGLWMLIAYPIGQLILKLRGKKAASEELEAKENIRAGMASLSEAERKSK
jgi:hypothetical protein